MIFLLLFFPISSYAFEFDCIKDEKAALKVGEAILVSVYGEQVLAQRPFKIGSTKKSWILDGTFHCPKGQVCFGGVARVEFNKHDAQVINIEHGK